MALFLFPSNKEFGKPVQIKTDQQRKETQNLNTEKQKLTYVKK